MTGPDPRLEAFARLLQVIDRLRGPAGCPWDRKQSLEAVAPHLLEEAYEVADAMLDGDRSKTAGELGDLLMNILLAARIGEDAGDFSLRDVADGITEKLVRRHPHVFAAVEVDGVTGVLRNWEEIKQKERRNDADTSTFAGIPAALPALLRAYRMGEKAASVGFEWPDIDGALGKLDEELAELKDAIVAGETGRIDEELGDVLFCAVVVARHAGVNPEMSLKRTSARFAERFRYLEARIDGPLRGADLADLLTLWREAKVRIADDPILPAAAPEEWRNTVRLLRATRSGLVAAVRDLPADLVARKPASEVSLWSIEEVMDHLERVERVVARNLVRALAAARGTAPPFPAEGLAMYPRKNRLFRPAGTVQSPAEFLPGGGRDRRELLVALERSRRDLLELVPRLSHVDPRAVLSEHFFFGELDALQWFEFQVGHERLHLAQIERIRSALS